MIASNTFGANSNDFKLPPFIKSYSQQSHDSSSFEEPKDQGIRVTTSLRTNPMTSRSTSGSDFTSIDPSFLARRYQKSHTTETFGTGLKTEFSVGTGPLNGKMMFDRLAKTEKVRVVRVIEEVEGAKKGPKMINMKFRLEDVDEDLLAIDDDSFHFGKLGIEVCPASSELRVFVRSSEEAYKLAEGFELSGLSLLRDRMFDIVYINGRGEKCLIGKTEFKRKKMRMYNVKKVQLYKICSNSSGLNSKTKDLHVKDAKREKVSFGTFTHLNENMAECHLGFPKACKPEERLMMVVMMLALMERTERYIEGKYNPILMFKRAVSNIIV